MSDHTQEPWQYNGPSSISIGGRVITLGYSRFNWATLATRTLREAHTRRIVACVNACMGLPIEALEKGAKP